MDSFTLHLLQVATQFFLDNKTQAYLVGGSVRDLLLGTPCTDWDIVTTGDTATLARTLASKLGGFYAHMHEKASRIIIKHDGEDIIFDIAPMHGRSIEADLRQRDFTLNALAVPLAAAFHALSEHEALPYIDPLQGALDIDTRTLRASNDAVFRHDTIRLLRAIRFATRYNLTIEQHTQELIRRDAPLLLVSASERIHAELYALLEAYGATDRLRLLDHYDLFTILFPELNAARGMAQPGLHHWDVFEHSLETVTALERLVATLRLQPDEIEQSPLDNGSGNLVVIHDVLQEAEQQGHISIAHLTSPPMKLAALLHDVGKTTTQVVHEDGKITFYGHPQAGVPLVQNIARRLSLSIQDQRLVRQVAANHMRPGQLSHDTVTQRAVRRYFVDLGPVGIAVALVSLADHLAMRGPEPLTEAWRNHLATVCLLLTRYIREREVLLPPHLVQPDELIRKFNLPQGPIIGQLLEQIAEARADSLIHSKDDVFWFVEEQLGQRQL